MREFEWIDHIRRRGVRAPGGWLGIGDDAAVLDAAGPVVVATDAIVEGVDFDDRLAPARVGRKALAVNLSDLAAMAARPLAFLLALGVPADWNGPRLSDLLSGIFGLARRHRIPCVGGDLTAADRLFACVTILGVPHRAGALTRSGARPGDLLLATGRFGGSIRRKHWAFRPRIAEAAWLADRLPPTAMIDVSDGLAQDLAHLLKASRCAARVDLARIPVSDAARRLHAGRDGALAGALSDGEDFELLLTADPTAARGIDREWKRAFPTVALTEIGRIERGAPGIRWFRDGIPAPGFAPPPGFSHF